MSKQAVRNFRRDEAQRVAELRAKKKKKKEDNRKQVDANDVKRNESGIRSARYNSSRVFSTPSPTFAIGDQVTNRPITAGKSWFASREDWTVDSINHRKAKCTNVNNPYIKQEWDLEYLEHKTASIGDMSREYCMKTLERDLLKRILERKDNIYTKKTNKLENTIQRLQTKVDALSDENDRMKVNVEKYRERQRELLSMARERGNELKEFKNGLEDAYSVVKLQIKV